MTSDPDPTPEPARLPEPAAAANDPELVRRDVFAGLAAGTIATLGMSALMLGAQRVGLLGEQPPRKIADAVLERVAGDRLPEGVRRAGTAAVHVGIGAVAAAGQQVGRRLLRWPEPSAAWGAGFGAAFWAVNYGLVAPAIGLMPPPTRDRPGRAPTMLAANVLWGALSAIVGDGLARGTSGRQGRALA